MNIHDRGSRDQNKSRVSFSRGLLKYMDEEPVVGRDTEVPGPMNTGPAIPAPIYTSTPKMDDLWHGSQGEWERIQAEKMELREKRYKDEIEWQYVRIQHLEQLLDGERRMVDTLSQFANMPWEYKKARVDAHRTNLEPESMEEVSLAMPRLITMDGDREEDRDAQGRRPEEVLTAQNIYSQRVEPEKLLQPQRRPTKVKGSESVEKSNEVIRDGKSIMDAREDLAWYEEYMQQRQAGKWDKGEGVLPVKELASVIVDRSVLESGEGAGKGGRAPRMKPTAYDGLTPYEDYRVQFHMIAELNGWDKPAKALYLAGCLSKGARSVLNDLKHEDRYDFDKLDGALRERYGTDDQAELFKAKLRSRIKVKEESLQELAHDIRRLVRLAYPKAASRMHDDLTKDQFIEALGDGEVRWSVFQARPKNITEALKVAMELEAFKESERSRVRKSVRGIKMEVEETPKVEKEIEVENEGIKKLELSMQKVIAQIGQIQLNEGGKRVDKENVSVKGGENKVNTWERRREGWLEGRREMGENVTRTGEGGPYVNRGPFDINRIRCYKCGKMGHYARECPEKVKKEAEGDEGNLNE
jgi:hypothetical protein